MARENIMRALPLADGLQAKVSPFSGKTYDWRLIDFEQASRRNLTAIAFSQFYAPNCVQLLEEIFYFTDEDDISDYYDYTYDEEDEEDEESEEDIEEQ